MEPSYTLKSLASASAMEDSVVSAADSATPQQERSEFKLLGLNDQNRESKASINRVSHRRHDPSTYIDTKSRIMAGAFAIPSGDQSDSMDEVHHSSRPLVSGEDDAVRPAGQRKGENRDPDYQWLSGGKADSRQSSRPLVSGEEDVVVDDAPAAGQRRNEDLHQDYHWWSGGQLEDRESARTLVSEDMGRQAGQRKGENRDPDYQWMTGGKADSRQSSRPLVSGEEDVVVNDAPAAGQRNGVNRDPIYQRMIGGGQVDHKPRNPLTGEGMTPTDPVQSSRGFNIRNKSSISFH